MGHSPREKPKKRIQSKRLCNRVTIFLLATRISRICSHQQVDDHRKEKEPHKQDIQQTKG